MTQRSYQQLIQLHALLTELSHTSVAVHLLQSNQNIDLSDASSVLPHDVHNIRFSLPVLLDGKTHTAVVHLHGRKLDLMVPKFSTLSQPSDLTLDTLSAQLSNWASSQALQFQHSSSAVTRAPRDQATEQQQLAEFHQVHRLPGVSVLVQRQTPAVTECQSEPAVPAPVLAVYVQTDAGERFRMPSKHMLPARAMARHLQQGGLFWDQQGQQLQLMAQELHQLGMFVRRTNRHQWDQQRTAEIVQAAADRLVQLRKLLHKLSTATGYDQLWSQLPTAVAPGHANTAKRYFTRSHYDTQLDQGLPWAWRAYAMKKHPELEIFENWANSVTDSAVRPSPQHNRSAQHWQQLVSDVAAAFAELGLVPDQTAQDLTDAQVHELAQQHAELTWADLPVSAAAEFSSDQLNRLASWLTDQGEISSADWDDGDFEQVHMQAQQMPVHQLLQILDPSISEQLGAPAGAPAGQPGGIQVRMADVKSGKIKQTDLDQMSRTSRKPVTVIAEQTPMQKFAIRYRDQKTGKIKVHYVTAVSLASAELEAYNWADAPGHEVLSVKPAPVLSSDAAPDFISDVKHSADLHDDQLQEQLQQLRQLSGI